MGVRALSALLGCAFASGTRTQITFCMNFMKAVCGCCARSSVLVTPKKRKKKIEIARSRCRRPIIRRYRVTGDHINGGHRRSPEVVGEEEMAARALRGVGEQVGESGC